MLKNIILNRRTEFKEWWHRPATVSDRIKAAVISALGGFWIGVLGKLIFGPNPVSGLVLGYWALGSLLISLILGACFPKIARIIFTPFAFFN